jgi:translation elongation factor EF-G
MKPQLSDSVLEIKTSIIKCQNTDAPAVVYVTKMQGFDSRLYDVITKSNTVSTEKQRLIAFARVFSGCLSRGQRVNIMGPRHMQ